MWVYIMMYLSLGCALMGYWAIMRSAQKAHARECLERAESAQGDIDQLSAQYASVNTARERIVLMKRIDSRMEWKRYWETAAGKWEAGDL